MNLKLEDWVRRNFEGETSLQQASPSAHYYWHRKRHQLKRLITDNRERIKKSLGEGATFLELGCATGIDLFLFYEWFKELGIKFDQVIGLDGDPLSNEVFNLRKEWAKKDIQSVSGNLEEPLPFPDKTVDFLYCSEVLEHIFDPEKFCGEMSRVMKPGGLLLLTTPNQPNVFQKNYWRPGVSKRMAELRQRLLQEGQLVTQNGKSFYLYFHISLQTCRTCDAMLQARGFRLVTYRRGAIRYGGTPEHDAPFVMVLYFLVEGLLDLLPLSLTRTFSDQIISMYEKVK
jgi:ubiquinone/menaquinone biosynthesis C-methylase UbiE